MERANTTKKHIIKVSLDLFSKKGYDGTTVSQIAKKLGIHERTIYNHFSSKDDLLKSIIDKHKIADISSKIISEDLVEDLNNPYRFLCSFTVSLIKYWNSRGERKFLKLLLMENFRKINGKSFAVKDYLNEIKSVLWMIFDEMINQEIIKNIDPVLLANEFIAPLLFIRIEYMSDEEPVQSLYLVHGFYVKAGCTLPQSLLNGMKHVRLI